MSLSTLNLINDPYLTIPLSTEVHQLARQFASEQNSPAKGKRVYLNTLAVAALHTYLTWVDLPSDLESSYSWHPLQRSAFDCADLYIPALGRIDCVVALPGENQAASPLAWEDTIAQVLVQFQESLASVNLVGYNVVIGEPEVSVSTDTAEGWFPLEQLPETLLRWQMGLEVLQSSNNEQARQLEECVLKGTINWPGVITLLSSCWKEPYLLRSRLEHYLEASSVEAEERLAMVTLGANGIATENEQLNQLETVMEGALELLGDLWRSLE